MMHCIGQGINRRAYDAKFVCECTTYSYKYYEYWLLQVLYLLLSTVLDAFSSNFIYYLKFDCSHENQNIFSTCKNCNTIEIHHMPFSFNLINRSFIRSSNLLHSNILCVQYYYWYLIDLKVKWISIQKKCILNGNHVNQYFTILEI